MLTVPILNSILSFSRFGAKLWNEIACHIRYLPKKGNYSDIIDILNSEDDYTDTPTLIKRVKLAKNVENKCLLISFYFYDLFV